jgi:hypothetical protein
MGQTNKADELRKQLTPAPPAKRLEDRDRTFPYEAACSGLRYENPASCGDVAAIWLDGKRWEVLDRSALTAAEARELVKRYEAAKRYGETREATLAALQEKTEQALAAAEARIKELEGRLQRIESNARNALLSLGVSEADAETPDPVFSLTVLAIGEHAKLAGLADLADQWAAASHTPMGEAYLVTKTQMANELKQAIAADLVAAAVAERCEENTKQP